MPGSKIPSLEPYIGKKIILGIRPEDIQEMSPGGSAEYGTIKAQVEVVEPLGAEIFLYLTTSKHAFIA